MNASERIMREKEPQPHLATTIVFVVTIVTPRTGHSQRAHTLVLSLMLRGSVGSRDMGAAPSRPRQLSVNV